MHHSTLFDHGLRTDFVTQSLSARLVDDMHPADAKSSAAASSTCSSPSDRHRYWEEMYSIALTTIFS